MASRSRSWSRLASRCGATAVAVAIALGGTRAHAEPARESVALLPIVVDGEMPASWREQLAVRMREGFARGNHAVVDAEAPLACDASCIRDVGRASGARWVARARVKVRERDFDVALELLDARSGESVTSSASTCEVCAVAEVGDMIADRAAVLDRKLEAMLAAPPVVRFESRPAKALVWLDGEMIGAAPIERTVTEGRHRARGELRGHLPIEVQFDALPGARETIALDLSPKPRVALRRARWPLLGIGVAGLAVGVPLVVLDGRQYRDRCSGGDVDADGDCRFRYDTKTGGAVALAIGGAALVSAIVLIAIARR
jgi:hypothetical protein